MAISMELKRAKETEMHVHYWLISTPAHGQHIIGICKLCGAERDFTELQMRDKGWGQICLANTMTRPEVTMSTIMAVKKPRGRPSNYSRGRVG